jgi:hypothetical protein
MYATAGGIPQTRTAPLAASVRGATLSSTFVMPVRGWTGLLAVLMVIGPIVIVDAGVERSPTDQTDC